MWPSAHYFALRMITSARKCCEVFWQPVWVEVKELYCPSSVNPDSFFIKYIMILLPFPFRFLSEGSRKGQGWAEGQGTVLCNDVWHM